MAHTLTIGRIGAGEKVHSVRGDRGQFWAGCNSRMTGRATPIASVEVSNPVEVAAALTSHHVPAASLCTKCFGPAVFAEMGK